MSPSAKRFTSVGFAAGSRLGSTPAPGRNDVTGGISPTSPGIIGIPLGMGIGMGADMLIPVMSFADVSRFGDCMPGMPAIPDWAGFFGGLAGGCCAPTALVDAQTASAAMTRDQVLTAEFRGKAGD